MKILKILLGEGGDVELGARTSKHIFVFVFAISLNSTLVIFCVVFISYSYMLDIILTLVSI